MSGAVHASGGADGGNEPHVANESANAVVGVHQDLAHELQVAQDNNARFAEQMHVLQEENNRLRQLLQEHEDERRAGKKVWYILTHSYVLIFPCLLLFPYQNQFVPF